MNLQFASTVEGASFVSMLCIIHEMKKSGIGGCCKNQMYNIRKITENNCNYKLCIFTAAETFKSIGLFSFKSRLVKNNRFAPILFLT